MMMSIKIDNMGISRIINKDITYIHIDNINIAMDINEDSINIHMDINISKVSYLSYLLW